MCLDCGCGIPNDDHGDPAHIVMAGLAAAADASGVSTLQAALNIVTTITTAAAPDEAIIKAQAEEQRFVLGVAYRAGKDPAIAKGKDGGRDFFTEAELEKAAWSFLRNGPVGGLFHIDGTEGACEFVESGIYRGPPWDLGDGVVVRKGDWLVGAILDEQAWDLHKRGKITGWSPQGVARRRKVQAAA